MSLKKIVELLELREEELRQIRSELSSIDQQTPRQACPVTADEVAAAIVQGRASVQSLGEVKDFDSEAEFFAHEQRLFDAGVAAVVRLVNSDRPARPTPPDTIEAHLQAIAKLVDWRKRPWATGLKVGYTTRDIMPHNDRIADPFCTVPRPSPQLVDMTDSEKMAALMDHGTPATRITWMEVAMALGTKGKTLDNLLSERGISNKKEVW